MNVPLSGIVHHLGKLETTSLLPLFRWRNKDTMKKLLGKQSQVLRSWVHSLDPIHTSKCLCCLLSLKSVLPPPWSYPTSLRDKKLMLFMFF